MIRSSILEVNQISLLIRLCWYLQSKGVEKLLSPRLTEVAERGQSSEVVAQSESVSP
jgi:hypothetical protein